MMMKRFRREQIPRTTQTTMALRDAALGLLNSENDVDIYKMIQFEDLLAQAYDALDDDNDYDLDIGRIL